MSSAVSQIEKLLDFLQGEPESLHLLDKTESCYVISGIEPEVPLGSGYSWQQRPALVEADRIYAKFRLLCGFTNLDCAAGAFQSVWHKKIIHSRPYSRVKSAFAACQVVEDFLFCRTPLQSRPMTLRESSAAVHIPLASKIS